MPFLANRFFNLTDKGIAFNQLKEQIVHSFINIIIFHALIHGARIDPSF